MCITMGGKQLLILGFLVAAVLAGSGARASGVQTRSDLDRDIPKLLTETKIPSVSVAEIRRGKIVLTAAYGMQSPGVPATVDTLYNIASLTKPLTAEVILRLVSEGRFGLDDPMYLFWVDPDIAADPRRVQLTPRLALSHQTGFPNWRAKSGLAFAFDPGTRAGYSGEGYAYVARFAEKRLAEGFEDMAQRVLFDADGMAHTAFTAKPWFEGRVAVPTSAAGVPLEATVAQSYNAADLVYTTAGDYARFMVGVLKDQGLSAAVSRERNRIQAFDPAPNCIRAKSAACPLRIGFGLGWQILVFKGETVMMHTGKDDGLFTFAYLNKTTGDGAVILTNGDEGYKTVIPILETLGASDAYLRFLKASV